MTNGRLSIAEPGLSRVGLGCSRFGSFNNPQSLRHSVRLVRDAMDLGVTTFDTSNIYGQGDSERAISTALAGGGRRHAFIITKGGRMFSAKARMLAWLKPLVRPVLAARGGTGGMVTARRNEVLGTDWSPVALTRSLDGSLRRLRTDAVDGFILHSPPATVAADPAVGAALASIKAAGKARHVGLSCDDAATLDAALAIPAVTILQLPVDLLPSLARHADVVEHRGIIVIAREVIRMQPALAPIAAVQTCLANRLVTSALVGTTRLAHLAQLAR
jgi:aryl-alcohol dehydrogenase-like predicted oxidoreductase